MERGETVVWEVCTVERVLIAQFEREGEHDESPNVSKLLQRERE